MVLEGVNKGEIGKRLRFVLFVITDVLYQSLRGCVPSPNHTNFEVDQDFCRPSRKLVDSDFVIIDLLNRRQDDKDDRCRSASWNELQHVGNMSDDRGD